MWMFFGMKNFPFNWLITGIVMAGMAGCAQIKKPPPQARAAPAGLRFDQVGRVSLYAGEPCTPQIMFDFHGTRSTASLAAPRNETEITTDAAKKSRPLHVLGTWRPDGQRQAAHLK